ncbi:uncharacterized protein LOC133194079 [Saccostrea echinata]|uniref:uncharacterized protein LOC133194079 n=1 Tax=Saccostrea echinata TaxID=191078 RepID=UPI002A825AFE|nr:uncharacterized protein LOC133194079 [Saccostrea echinata]
MGQISIEYVVSFTSQDEKFKANNLTCNTGYKKWLTSPSDRSGQAVVMVQLKRPLIISYIDLGTIWCATVEIKVGRSELPLDQEFLTLVPTSSIMTPQDCRTESSSGQTRMFGPADFASDVVKQKWDRVKIICRQPFKRNVQMGLSFICVKIPGNGEASPEKKQSTPKTVKSIQKHFFGKLSSSDSKTCELKSRLMKIASSGEEGSEQEHCLNRNAKLVLAATGSVNQFSVPPKITSPEGKSKLYSRHVAQQLSPQFEEEALSFLDNDYEFKKEELDKITIADIRHKFEKKIKRKLTAEEKKVFINLSSEYICEIFMEKDREKETENETYLAVGGKNSFTSGVDGNPFQERDKNCTNKPTESVSTSSSQKAYGPSYKSTNSVDCKTGTFVNTLKSPYKVRQSSFVSTSVCKQFVTPLPKSSTDNEWLSCATPPSNGKRKRESDEAGSDRKLNRGAKRQQLEAEERNWLGIEGVKSGWVSTAATPGVTPNKVTKTEGGKARKKEKNKRASQTPVRTVESQGADVTKSEKGTPATELDVYEEYTLDSPTAFVECPICTEMFSKESIEVHAAVCVEMNSVIY